MPLSENVKDQNERKAIPSSTEPEEKKIPLIVAVGVIVLILGMLCLAFIGMFKLFF